MRRPAVLLSTLLIAAACGPKSPDDAVVDTPITPQQVTITASEFEFAAPDTIAPGMTAFTLVNNGAQAHHVILARLDDGKTMADVQTVMAESPEATPEWLTFYGAASGIAPGGSAGSTVDLPAGQYVMICFVPDPADGAPHAMKGMVRPLVVAGTENLAAAPTADAEIELKDFGFVLPNMTAGAHTFHVTNSGPALHEVQLVKLADGATADSYAASLAPGYTGPRLGTDAGGGGAISTGIEQWWTVNLEPGNYLVTCFVPDETGKPHLMLGMIQEFTVAPAS